MTSTDPTPSQQLSDRAVSLIRTRVPILWGSLIAALLTWASPYLPGAIGESLGNWLSSEAVVAVIGAAVIYAWYWAWRRFESRIPEWLTRIVLGSAQQPMYSVLTPAERDADEQAAIARRAADPHV